jgi:phosphonate transport system substrate-binding protein
MGLVSGLRLLLVASAILLTGSMMACKSSQPNGYPTVLHYVYSPSEEEGEDSSMRASMMQEYLTSQLHIPVKIIRVAGYSASIEAMHTDKADIATFGPLGYIIASQKAGAQAIVTRGNPDHTVGSYNSIIAVPKDSPLHSIGDLKAHAKDVVFMFVDPASTSGYLVPHAYLQSIGINPERDFKKVVFAGYHLAGVLTIKSGKVDAGAVMKQLYIPRLIALGKLAPDDLRILWTSEPIPTSPICVRGSLPEPLKAKIREAMLAIPQKDPALWESIKKSARHPDMTYVPVSNSTYDGMRKFAAQMNNLNINEK